MLAAQTDFVQNIECFTFTVSLGVRLPLPHKLTVLRPARPTYRYFPTYNLYSSEATLAIVKIVRRTFLWLEMFPVTFNTRHWTSPLRLDNGLEQPMSNCNVKNSKGLGSSQYYSLTLLHCSHLWFVGFVWLCRYRRKLCLLSWVWWNPPDGHEISSPGQRGALYTKTNKQSQQHRRCDDWVCQSSPWRSEECSRWWIQEAIHATQVGTFHLRMQ